MNDDRWLWDIARSLPPDGGSLSPGPLAKGLAIALMWLAGAAVALVALPFLACFLLLLGPSGLVIIGLILIIVVAILFRRTIRIVRETTL